MNLLTERLVIKPISQEETKNISKLNDDGGLSAFLASIPDDDVETIFKNGNEVEKFVSRICSSIGNGDSDIYGAFLDTILIGYIAIVNYKSDIPELQIEIIPEYHKQGFGYEFMSALLPELFRKYDMTAIQYTQ